MIRSGSLRKRSTCMHIAKTRLKITLIWTVSLPSTTTIASLDATPMMPRYMFVTQHSAWHRPQMLVVSVRAIPTALTHPTAPSLLHKVCTCSALKVKNDATHPMQLTSKQWLNLGPGVLFRPSILSSIQVYELLDLKLSIVVQQQLSTVSPVSVEDKIFSEYRQGPSEIEIAIGVIPALNCGLPSFRSSPREYVRLPSDTVHTLYDNSVGISFAHVELPIADMVIVGGNVRDQTTFVQTSDGMSFTTPLAIKAIPGAVAGAMKAWEVSIRNLVQNRTYDITNKTWRCMIYSRNDAGGYFAKSILTPQNEAVQS